MNHDRLFRAFSDPIRRRAVRLLARRTLCVCDLVSVLKLPQPTVSRHLSALETAGVLRAEKRGRWRHYALVDGKDRVASGLVASATAEADTHGDAARLKALARRTC